MKDIKEVFKTPEEFIALKDKTPEEIKSVIDENIETITLEQAKAIKEIITRIANKEFTKEDLNVLKTITSKNSDELNQEDLQAIAGGGWNVWSYIWRSLCTVPAAVADVVGWAGDGYMGKAAHDSWTKEMWKK